MKLYSAVLKIYDPNTDHGMLHQMFAMRKRLFVDHMGWDLDEFGDIEVDQYDNPLSHYIVVYSEQRQVVGCTRLIPTTSQLKTGYSYMIRDAARGILDGLPKDVISDPPVRPDVWEATRFAVADLSIRDRNAVLKKVCEAAVDFARDNGIKEILGLMNPMFLRFLPKWGFDVSAAGPMVHAGDEPCCVIRYMTH